jgi:hypothetical protein
LEHKGRQRLFTVFDRPKGVEEEFREPHSDVLSNRCDALTGPLNCQDLSRSLPELLEGVQGQVDVFSGGTPGTIGEETKARLRIANGHSQLLFNPMTLRGDIALGLKGDNTIA